MTVTRILIWSATRLHSEGLAKLLSPDAAFDIRTTTSFDDPAIREARCWKVDIVLVDLDGPDSQEAIGALADGAPGVPIVALSVPRDEVAVVEYAKAGATAFVSREATLDDLRRAVVLAARGESPGPPWLTPMLLRRLAVDAGASHSAAALDRLTRREHEVLELIASGLANKQIARTLHIELPTVKNHVHRILEKLEVSGRAEAGAQMRAVHANARS